MKDNGRTNAYAASCAKASCGCALCMESANKYAFLMGAVNHVASIINIISLVIVGVRLVGRVALGG